MKVLIIGGTGTISSPITRLLSQDETVELTLLNRGSKPAPKGVKHIKADINDEATIKDLLKKCFYDVVINFIVYDPEEAKRDVRLFTGKTNQYIFVSTNVVLNHHEHCVIDETVPRGNRISLYGQAKASCERVYLDAIEFPVTIVRPSHTYSNDRFPVAVKGKNTWSVIDRMLKGKEILVHDHGQSIWPITHANDFARLFVSVVGHEESIGEIYHIMNPTILTWDMIYIELSKQLGVKYNPYYVSSDILSLNARFGFDQALLGDKTFSNIFKIDKILALNSGFKFEYDLKRGVSEFLDYMDKNPHLKEDDDVFDVYSDALIESINQFKMSISK